MSIMENTITPSDAVIKDQLVEQTPEQKEHPASEARLSEAKLARYREQLTHEQNYSLGAAAGVAACVVSAVLWAVITVTTEYQIGYMAVALGFAVGYAIRYAGNGIDKIFGITGAVLSLAGCLLGNFFSLIGFAAKSEGLDYLQVFSMIDYGMVPALMMETFSPMDLLFYGIAVYEGYKFSFRQITEQELIANAAE
jgi:hypothetical protein